jgi:hypothetical protein
MEKTFEEIAADLIKMYVELRLIANKQKEDWQQWSIENEYSLNSPESMANQVCNLANTLADNYRNRAVDWDKENFDREVERMLTTKEMGCQ